jgi:cadmium resistance protein CadD (predicted permease)
MMSELFKLGSKVVITFILTNIQDIVILINFFLESSKPESLLKTDHVILGQYLGFSTLLMLSLIGYTISYILPVKLFGFLGFLIIFFGLQGLNQLIKDLRKKTKNKKQNSQEILEAKIEFIQFETVNIY